MQEIAKILEVDVIYFFQEQQSTFSKVEEPQHPIGYASKSDIEDLMSIINKMQREIANLKTNLQPPVVKKKTRK